MIRLKEVSKFYSNNGVTNIGLSNINLELKRNEIVAIVGESGSGKTTLLNVIAKLDTFDEGEIFYYGNETSYFNISDMDDFRKNKVGFIFQNYNIIDSYTVLDNVMIPLLLKGLSKEDAKVEAMLLIKKVGLAGREKHRGSKLSGGEKQRCVIARALASDCDILACDEPTGNLDSKTALEIISLLKEVAKDKLVLIVTHNYEEVEPIATRLLKMADGKIVEDLVFVPTKEEENKELELDYVPLNKKVIWRLGINNIIRTPKKTFITCLMYFIISFCFLFVSSVIGSNSSNILSYNVFNNTFDNRLFVYGKNASVIDTKLLSGYNYEVNDFATQIEYNYSFTNESVWFNYASNVPNYKLLKGRMPENDNEFILLYNSPTDYTLTKAERNLDEYLVFEVNNGTSYERFKLVGIGSYKSNGSDMVCAAFCPKLQNILNKAAPKYTLKINGFDENISVKLISGTTSPKLYIPSNEYSDVLNYELYCEIYKINNFDIVVHSGNKTYIEISIDGGDVLEPYFASVYTNSVKIKKVMKALNKESLQVIYPKEYTSEDAGVNILSQILAFMLMIEFNAYLIGFFFIVYVILSKVYRSRVKDYSILRTLGITKKDMAKIVRVEMLVIGLSVTLITYLIFNGMIYSMNALLFLREIGVSVVITYFFVMFIFNEAMSSRFNKRIFKFTVRESVRGDDDND